jgi:hypothetical protein
VNVNGANHDNDDDDDDEEDENEEDSDLENGQFRIRRHDEELNDYLTVGLNKKDDDTDIHSSRTKYQIMWSRCYRLAGGILVLLSLDFVITRAYGRAFLFASASAIPTTVTATPTGTAMSTSSIGKNSLHVLMEDLWMGTPTEVDCVVVGSGVTGCTAAFYLQQHLDHRVSAGGRVVLCEARDTVGGNFISRNGMGASLSYVCLFECMLCVIVRIIENGFIYEEGPNSMQPTPALLRLSQALNITHKLVTADPSLPRYIYWNNELHALPHSLFQFVFNWPLVSTWGKLRAVCGMCGLFGLNRRRDDNNKEETIRDFATRHLGNVNSFIVHIVLCWFIVVCGCHQGKKYLRK